MFAHFGAAIYLASTLEHGLAIALLYADLLTKVRAKVDTAGLETEQAASAPSSSAR